MKRQRQELVQCFWTWLGDLSELGISGAVAAGTFQQPQASKITPSLLQLPCPLAITFIAIISLQQYSMSSSPPSWTSLSWSYSSAVIYTLQLLETLTTPSTSLPIAISVVSIISIIFIAESSPSKSYCLKSQMSALEIILKIYVWSLLDSTSPNIQITFRLIGHPTIYYGSIPIYCPHKLQDSAD